MNDQDELIFGKNAVLAYLERAASQAQEERDSSASGNSDHKAFKRMSRVKIHKIMIADGMRFDARLDKIQSLARLNKIPVHGCERRKLDQLAGPDRRHQGVVALVAAAELWQLDTFLEKL